MKPYILGLDLGPNSIGWALIEARRTEDGALEPVGFLDVSKAGHGPLGVRVFEAGLQNYETGKEKSLNQKRRQARSARRTLARRKVRKAKSKRILQQAGLLPPDGPELDRVIGLNPYELRSKALDCPLPPFEFGRALYHLAQRRGFKSNRLGVADAQESVYLEAIEGLAAQIEQAGARTLGEFLFSEQTRKFDGAMPIRLRARQARMDLYLESPRRTRRSMYELEFRALIKSQVRLNAGPILTRWEIKRLYHALFDQRDFLLSDDRIAKAPKRANLHRAPSIRPCPLEHGRKGCPKSDWLAQRFRILKEVQNLRVSEVYESERVLSEDEREFCIAQLSASKTVKLTALAKKLAKRFGWREPASFNLERGDRTELKGNAIESMLSKAFGTRKWASVEPAVQVALRGLLQNAESEADLDRALVDAGLSDDKAREALIAFSPTDEGYMSYSRRALQKLVPLLEQGRNEYEAIQEAYPERNTMDGLDQLPSFVAMQLDDEIRGSIPGDVRRTLLNLSNPVVNRALGEIRKVVNALIREHGKPARIVVEMARELKRSKEHRKSVSTQNRAREKRRKDCIASIQELRPGRVSRTDIDRWILWKNQKDTCLYCGNHLGIAQLFGDELDIDHVVPRWRSLDDSLPNKVVCHRACNAAKGNRTVAEWKGVDSEDFKQIVKRTQECLETKKGNDGVPKGTLARIRTTVVNADQFASSQLNDTKYISRRVALYLELLYPSNERAGQKMVQSTRGGLTAHLRRLWGLNGIIPLLPREHGQLSHANDCLPTKKSRDDHRHHAVDALCVALSTRSSIKRLQDYYKNEDSPTARSLHLPLPWPNLRTEAESHLESINVSHRPSRRQRGGLHEETFYGKVEGPDDIYVSRKRLEELTGSMVMGIRDPRVRKVVEERARKHGWDGKSNALPKEWCRDLLFLPTAVPKFGRKARASHPIHRVRVLTKMGTTVPLGKNAHRWAKPGSNFFFEVIETDAEFPRIRVVTRFESNLNRSPSALPGGNQMGRVHRKDSLRVQIDGLKERVLVVLQNCSGPPSNSLDLVLRDARDSRTSSKDNKPLCRISSPGGWNALMPVLVEVDVLGREGNNRNLFLKNPEPLP